MPCETVKKSRTAVEVQPERPLLEDRDALGEDQILQWLAALIKLDRRLKTEAQERMRALEVILNLVLGRVVPDSWSDGLSIPDVYQLWRDGRFRAVKGLERYLEARPTDIEEHTQRMLKAMAHPEGSVSLQKWLERIQRFEARAELGKELLIQIETMSSIDQIAALIRKHYTVSTIDGLPDGLPLRLCYPNYE